MAAKAEHAPAALQRASAPAAARKRPALPLPTPARCYGKRLQNNRSHRKGLLRDSTDLLLPHQLCFFQCQAISGSLRDVQPM
jgi:hypothetical protein